MVRPVLTTWWILLVVLWGGQASGRPFPEVPFVEGDDYGPGPWNEALTQEAETIAGRFSGRFGAYVSDPYRGFAWGYNADRPFYLASGVKLTFMVEVFRQRELGRLSFDEMVTYTADDIRDGAPRINRLRIGQKLDITTLLDYMMRSSDNAASDMLAKRVTLASVQRGLKAEGLFGFTPLTFLIDVRRGFYREVDIAADDLTPEQIRKIRWTKIWNPQIRVLNDMLGKPPRTYTKTHLLAAYQRYYDTGVNHAPMRSVGRLFEKMVRGELVSETASEEMLTLMTGARTSTHRLLGRLPRGTKVAHKTGSQYLRLCDLGVIFLPDDTPLIVTVCTEEGSVPQAEAVVAKIARKAYDVVWKEHQTGDRGAP